MQYFSDAVFIFCVLGAGAAAAKHYFSTKSALLELTPVALHNGTPSPEGAWWGGTAFAAMNAGFFAVGMHALATWSLEGRRGVLLGTGIMFFAFAAAWFSEGHKTGHPSPHRQGSKIAAFGTLFICGYIASLL